MSTKEVAKLNILVVDDNQIDLNVIVGTLSKSKKFKVSSATGFQNSLLLAKTKKFDLAFYDYFLGDGLGLDVLKMNLDLPVVILTGQGTEQTVIETLTQGAYDYIIKDINNTYLKKVETIAKEILQIKKLGFNLSESISNIDSFLKDLHQQIEQENLSNIDLQAMELNFRKMLSEKELTLKNVVSLQSSQKSAAHKEIFLALSEEILPFIHQLKNGAKNKKEILNRLKAAISNYIVRADQGVISTYITNLTPTEKKICKLLKLGVTIKEIAGKLDIAVSTAYDHTKAIRKKFNISGSKVNLTSYLSTLDLE